MYLVDILEAFIGILIYVLYRYICFIYICMRKKKGVREDFSGKADMKK